MFNRPRITEEMINADPQINGGNLPTFPQKVVLQASVVQIALGVLLGNLVTGVIGMLIWAIVVTSS